MAALPLVVKLLLALGLLWAMSRAFCGAPPARPRPAAARLALALAVAGAALAVAGAPTAGAVLAASLAGWCGRAAGEGEPGGPDGPPAPDAPPPVDWDAFDRARAGWSRPRTPAG